MPFGNEITSFPVIADSTNGSIVQINLYTVRIKKIYSIQMERTDGTFSSVLTIPLTVAQLFSLLSSSGPIPDLAMAQTSTNLFVFLNADTYAIAATEGIGLTYYRNSIPILLASTKVDVPDDTRSLFVAIIKKLARSRGDRIVGFDVTQDIIRQKIQLGLLL
jgi:hypothetical protein